MNTESTVNIIKDICEAIGRSGNECAQWEVGVTANLEHLSARLRIPPDFRWCVYRRASSALEAQAIAKAFWNIDCKKSSHGAEVPDKTAVYIFAFRKNTSLNNATFNTEACSPPSQLETGLEATS